jgi:hypothetical protein
MIATADSRVRRSICVIRRNPIRTLPTLAVWLPSRVIKRCPAIILAANRTAKVPGRIMLLIVSITTIKGIRIPGVLCGTRCANICLV